MKFAYFIGLLAVILVAWSMFGYRRPTEHEKTRLRWRLAKRIYGKAESVQNPRNRRE